jgi:TolB-like protein/tetratricopeptide (TPR) repeat protein
MSIWGQLKRRKVVRVAAGYAVAGWVLLQLTDVLVNLLNLPDWIGRMVVLIIVVGFPVAMTIAWIFNFTSDGIVRDPERSEKRFGVKVDYILLTAVLLLTGWLLYQLGFNEKGPYVIVDRGTVADEPLRESITAPLENSVAILPFDNLSPDPDNAYFAAGLHEEVLTQLAHIRGLKVISRKSVLQYADRNIGIPQIADELHVESVMAGSARFSGDKVRIKAQLIDGQTDEHLWVEVYEREFVDIFSIQADIAERIAGEFKAGFLPEDRKYIESQSSTSPLALANYLRAVSLDWGGSRDKDRALALLDQAIAEDPEFSSALALRALVHATSLNNTPGSRDDWRLRNQQLEQIARSDAERSLELDAAQGRAYVAIARINQYRWKGAEARQAYEDGLRVVPNDVDLLRGFAWFNSVDGNHQKAIELAKRAVNIDPMNDAAHAELGQRYTFAGQWDAAYTSHQAAISLNPDYGVHHLRLANNEVARGNLANAIRELRTAEEILDLAHASPELLAELAYAYTGAGSKENALRIVEMMDDNSSNLHVGIGARAMAMLAIGQYSEALVLLREAGMDIINGGDIDGGFKSLAQIAANVLADPVLDQAEFAEIRSQLTFRD